MIKMEINKIKIKFQKILKKIALKNNHNHKKIKLKIN